MREDNDQTGLSELPSEDKSVRRKSWTAGELRQMREMAQTLGIFVGLLLITLFVIAVIRGWAF